MKTRKTIVSVLSSLAIVFLLSSCEKEQQLGEGNASLQFTAVTGTSTLKSTSAPTPAAGLVINEFKINIGEIEFEFYDNPNDQFPDGESYSEFELEGPFEIDLVKNGNTQLSTLVAGITLPVATFDEIEFEFERSENRNSLMYGKTILVTGTINGIPFEYFSTIDEFAVEIEFERPVNLAETQNATITVSINLAAIFNPAMGGVDITGAKDGNGNGKLEIHENDNDGNRALASRIETAIYQAIEAKEEDDDDDDDDGDDD